MQRHKDRQVPWFPSSLLSIGCGLLWLFGLGSLVAIALGRVGWRRRLPDDRAGRLLTLVALCFGYGFGSLLLGMAGAFAALQAAVGPWLLLPWPIAG